MHFIFKRHILWVEVAELLLDDLLASVFDGLRLLLLHRIRVAFALARDEVTLLRLIAGFLAPIGA
jgi:hypothetical protein